MLMDSRRLIFDSSPGPAKACHGNMLFLGNGDHVFRGMGGGGVRSVVGVEENNYNNNGKRRAFFSTTPEELMLMDPDDYYDDPALSPEKKRRLTPDQVQMLERSFEEENKLEPERKSELARKLGLQPRQVAVWFQNRRARWKTKQLERDFDRLKSSYDSLLAHRDSLLNDNLSLRSQVLSLTEKLNDKVADPAVASTTTVGGGAVGTTLPQQQPDQAAAAAMVVFDGGDAGLVGPKGEDHLSTAGSGVGSAVVDQESPHHLVDSGNSSYFLDDMGSCYSQGYGEDDGVGSDLDGRGYFSGVFPGGDGRLEEVAEEEEVGNLLVWLDWS